MNGKVLLQHLSWFFANFASVWLPYVGLAVLIGALVAVLVRLRLTHGDPLPLQWIAALLILLICEVLKGALLLNASGDPSFHSTYFVVVHYHYALQLGAAFAVFAGWYRWFPKLTGCAYAAPIGPLHFWLTQIGVLLGLAPSYAMLMLLPRVEFAEYPDQFAVWNRLVLPGFFISVAALLVFALGTGHAIAKRIGLWRAGPKT